MRLLRHLPHWIPGRGLQSAVAELVPETHRLREWADTFPWAALGAAVERNFAQRFPPRRRGDGRRGRRGLSGVGFLPKEKQKSSFPRTRESRNPALSGT